MKPIFTYSKLIYHHARGAKLVKAVDAFAVKIILLFNYKVTCHLSPVIQKDLCITLQSAQAIGEV